MTNQEPLNLDCEIVSAVMDAGLPADPTISAASDPAIEAIIDPPTDESTERVCAAAGCIINREIVARYLVDPTPENKNSVRITAATGCWLVHTMTEQE
ncbi:MAG TPA: hypothetical protein VLF43_01250 [Candidatus Saccharimonadales bacterium]|nr:hypothetical protein [Candidatus Saccharimonadales bacterium]